MVESYQTSPAVLVKSSCLQLSSKQISPVGRGQREADAGTAMLSHENLFRAYLPWFYSSLLDMDPNFSRLFGQLPRISESTPTKSRPRLCLRSPKGHAKYDQVPMRLASQRYSYRVCLTTLPHQPLLPSYSHAAVPYLHSRCVRLHRLPAHFDYQ